MLRVVDLPGLIPPAAIRPRPTRCVNSAKSYYAVRPDHIHELTQPRGGLQRARRAAGDEGLRWRDLRRAGFISRPIRKLAHHTTWPCCGSTPGPIPPGGNWSSMTRVAPGFATKVLRRRVDGRYVYVLAGIRRVGTGKFCAWTRKVVATPQAGAPMTRRTLTA